MKTKLTLSVLLFFSVLFAQPGDLFLGSLVPIDSAMLWIEAEAMLINSETNLEKIVLLDSLFKKPSFQY